VKKSIFPICAFALLALAPVTLSEPEARAGCPISRPPERRFDASPGVFLNYRTVGSAGPVIVAIHGFGGALDTWDDIAPMLSTRYRLYLPDLVGFGHSARPKSFGYTIGEQAEAVAGFLEMALRETGEAKLTLIGHSYGGAVAIAACLRLKDKGEAIVDHLILIDALGFAQEEHFPPFIDILRVWGVNRSVLHLLPAKTQVRMVLKNIFHNPAAVTEERICRYADFLPASHAGLIKTAHQLGDAAAVGKFTQRIHEIDVPTLIVWGKYDKVIPPRIADRFLEAILGSRAAPPLEAGHAPQEELPHETAQLIEAFLNGGSI
jgi:pimeloyl-ACP methyl ester carboxylesterase